MPKICYIDKNFSEKNQAVIDTANSIIEEYALQGFDLTVRQLYYQFVARDLVENTLQSYKRLGSIINDARLAGQIDWDSIDDRTRFLRDLTHWESPQEILRNSADGYMIDRWQRQGWKPEVWIEKDALIGVISGVCEELDVPYFSCRGYSSQSKMWRAAMRLKYYSRVCGQTPIIFHLGDHDPSGKDMTRDIIDRLTMFSGDQKVDRLALNMDQIEQYTPPPNPAKLSDSRAAVYIAEFGYDSWELDALEPTVIAELIREAVLQIRDEDQWQEAIDEEDEAKERLSKIADDWEE